MSIRLRIALLTSALMTVLLLAIGGGVYYTLRRSLSHELDTQLANVAVILDEQPRVIERNLITGEIEKVRIPSIDPFAAPGLYVQISGVDGTFFRNAPDSDSFLDMPPPVIEANRQGNPVYFTTNFRGFQVRVLSWPVKDRASGEVLFTTQVVQPLAPMMQTLQKLRLFLLFGTGLGVLATAVGAFILSGRSLRPLARITTAARQIGQAGDLSQRIHPSDTRDEVQQLAETFNEMLTRLEAAFAAERRFVSDASHELRTPLTALRGNAEILLRQIEAGYLDPEDLKDGLSDIRDEAERMGRLVHNLLTLARADVGWRPELELVHLDQVVADVARVAAPLAGNHHFTADIDDEVDILGNADQLKQLLLILLDNAFRYTPDDGSVEISLRRLDHRAEITVRDNGPGIPPEQRDRIFDRFYRGDVARVHGTSGAGLGLAIARWIVECHRGEICADGEAQQGTAITVRLPLIEPGNGKSAVAPTARPIREPAAVTGRD